MVLALTLIELGLLKAESVSLSALCDDFGLKFKFHNALEDAKATFAVYKKLLEIIVKNRALS